MSSRFEAGDVRDIDVESRLGEECRLRNPWGRSCVVEEVGGSSRVLEGDMLRFTTIRRGKYRICPKE